MNYAQFYLGLKIFGVATGGSPPPAGALLAVNNLSDVPNKPLALTNLGALPVAGGTMTGALTLAADPVSGLQPVTLQYFNAHVGNVTLTGDVTGSGMGTIATTIANSAVTLGKIQNLNPFTLIGNGSGLSGIPDEISFSTFLQVSNNLSELTGTASTARTNLGLGTAATKTASSNIPSVVASVVSPIAADNIAIFSDNAGTLVDHSIPYTNLATLSGSTFTGTVILAADPVVALGAATKQYADSVSGRLPVVTLSAGTHTVAMNTQYFVDSSTGAVTLNLPPSWAVGDLLNVYGIGNISTGYGWVIQCGVGQRISSLGTSTTSGGQLFTRGFNTSGAPGNNVAAGVELIGQTANTVLRVRNASAEDYLSTA